MKSYCKSGHHSKTANFGWVCHDHSLGSVYSSLDSWLIYLSLTVRSGFIVISSAWRLVSVFAVFWDSLLLLRYVEFQDRQVELTQVIVSMKVYRRSTEGHIIKVLNTEIIQIDGGHFT